MLVLVVLAMVVLMGVRVCVRVRGLLYSVRVGGVVMVMVLVMAVLMRVRVCARVEGGGEGMLCCGAVLVVVAQVTLAVSERAKILLMGC